MCVFMCLRVGVCSPTANHFAAHVITSVTETSI